MDMTARHRPDSGSEEEEGRADLVEVNLFSQHGSKCWFTLGVGRGIRSCLLPIQFFVLELILFTVTHRLKVYQFSLAYSRRDFLLFWTSFVLHHLL